MLPDERLPMPPQWRELLEQLGPVFARRSTFRLFTALACGLILADRGTVTGMAAAAGIGHQWRRACWFFSAAAWDPGALGLAVARVIVKYLLVKASRVAVAVDGTFFRRWGKHVVILSFRVSRGCDLRRPVRWTVSPTGRSRPDHGCFTPLDRYLIGSVPTAGHRTRGRAGGGAVRSRRRAACCGRGRRRAWPAAMRRSVHSPAGMASAEPVPTLSFAAACGSGR